MPGGGPVPQTHHPLPPAGLLVVHTPPAILTVPPNLAPISYLVHKAGPSNQEVTAAMEVRLPVSTTIAPWGSCPVREGGG